MEEKKYTRKGLLRHALADQVSDYRFSLRRLAEGEMSNADMAAEEQYAAKCLGRVREIFKNRNVARTGTYGQPCGYLGCSFCDSENSDWQWRD